MPEKKQSSSDNENYFSKMSNYLNSEQTNKQYNSFPDRRISFTFKDSESFKPSDMVGYQINEKMNSFNFQVIRKTNRICENCGVTTSPSWRKSPCGKFILCNACGLYAKLHKKPRPYISMRNGRTKVAKKTIVPRIICYFCQSVKQVKSRPETNHRLTCEACYQGILLDSQANFYHLAEHNSNVGSNSLYQNNPIFDQSTNFNHTYLDCSSPIVQFNDYNLNNIEEPYPHYEEKYNRIYEENEDEKDKKM